MEELLVSHVFAKLVGYPGEVLERDVVLILGEKNECLLQLGLVVSLAHLRYHYVQEIAVINQHHSFLVLVVTTTLRIVVKILDQPLDLLLGRLEAKSSQSDFEVLDVDATRATGVEEGKGFLYLCLLLLGQFIAVLVSGLLFLSLCAPSSVFRWELFDSVWLVLIAFLCLKKISLRKMKKRWEFEFRVGIAFTILILMKPFIIIQCGL